VGLKQHLEHHLGDLRTQLQLVRLVGKSSPAMATALVLLTVLGAAAPIGFALATGWLVRSAQDAVASGESSVAAMAVPLIVVGALYILPQLLSPLVNTVADSLGRRADARVQRQISDIYSRTAGIDHLENPAARDASAVAAGLSTTKFPPGSIAGAYSTILSLRLAALAAAVILATYQVWLGVVLAVWPLVHRHLPVQGFRRTAESAVSSSEEFRRSDYARELILSSRQVGQESRIFGFGEWLRDGFDSQWRQIMTGIWNERWEAKGVEPIRAFIGMLLLLMAFYALGHAAIEKAISLSALAVYLQAALTASGIFFGPFDLAVARGAQIIPALRRLDHTTPRALTGTTDLHSSAGPVAPRLDDVSFTYPRTSKQILASVSLEIPAGKTTAIVGANGSGKSTLIKLICGLYLPNSGTISLDGNDLSASNQEQWQRSYAAVFQDFIRYELSFAENIVLADHAAGPDELLAADRFSGADRLLDSIDWSTPLSPRYEGGTDLSGGQWQSVALSRAWARLAAGAQVLVLDEPTANMDISTEINLFNQIVEQAQGVTTLLVSHRMSSVRRADKIVVLVDGRIVEEGSHTELMSADGEYARMFTLQAKRYSLADDTGTGFDPVEVKP